jgi:hypothetical protein
MVDRYSSALRIVVCTGLSLIFALTVFSTDLATLSGSVVDPMNAVIPNSRVIVHWDSAGLDGVKDNVGINDDKSVTTDEAGHFSLDLPPGVYDVVVMAKGFSPHCEKLTIQTEKIHSYKVQLKVSRMTTIILDH